MNDVTQILSRIDSGDPTAAEELLPLVYDGLRQLAAQRLAQERPGQTLQATALVHEAYLRLVDGDKAQHWNSRGHFFGAAAEAMRRILVEQARRKSAVKRGGERVQIDINHLTIEDIRQTEKLVELDEALTRLAELDPLKAELVKLRFFAGLPIREAAQILDISTATADRYWVFARAWLQREMGGKS
jgi:RNA polymerase sigma factor (TIGR02999 family)